MVGGGEVAGIALYAASGGGVGSFQALDGGRDAVGVGGGDDD